MNITDEDREALAVLLRNELRADSDGFGSCDLGASMADAILNSDVFAHIVQAQRELNNPSITSEVSAYHADPTDIVEEVMPIEYRVLVENDVVFVSGYRATAEGYIQGLKLHGERGRLEVVAVGDV